MNKKFNFFLALSLSFSLSFADALAEGVVEDHHFYLMPLGVSGGEFQDNMSAYLVSALGDNHFVALDAGVLCSAINKLPESFFDRLNIQPPLHQTAKSVFFTDYIKAYLISHA